MAIIRAQRGRLKLFHVTLGLALLASVLVPAAAFGQLTRQEDAAADAFLTSNPSGMHNMCWIDVADEARWYGGSGPPSTEGDQILDILVSQFYFGDPADPADDFWRDGVVSVRTADLSVGKKLESVQVQEEVPIVWTEWDALTGYHTESGTLDVDLTWTASGPLESNREHRVDRYWDGGIQGHSGYLINYHFRGASRDAVLTGTLMDSVHGVDVLAGMTGSSEIWQGTLTELTVSRP